jgi:hypothetical protein
MRTVFFSLVDKLCNMKLTPYLNFAGNAQEAFDFYANALDGQVVEDKFGIN